MHADTLPLFPSPLSVATFVHIFGIPLNWHVTLPIFPLYSISVHVHIEQCSTDGQISPFKLVKYDPIIPYQS